MRGESALEAYEERGKKNRENRQGRSEEEHQSVTSVTTVGRKPCAWTQELLPICGKGLTWV